MYRSLIVAFFLTLTIFSGNSTHAQENSSTASKPEHNIFAGLSGAYGVRQLSYSGLNNALRTAKLEECSDYYHIVGLYYELPKEWHSPWMGASQIGVYYFSNWDDFKAGTSRYGNISGWGIQEKSWIDVLNRESYRTSIGIGISYEWTKLTMTNETEFSAFIETGGQNISSASLSSFLLQPAIRFDFFYTNAKTYADFIGIEAGYSWDFNSSEWRNYLLNAPSDNNSGFYVLLKIGTTLKR